MSPVRLSRLNYSTNFNLATVEVCEATVAMYRNCFTVASRGVQQSELSHSSVKYWSILKVTYCKIHVFYTDPGSFVFYAPLFKTAP
jgi:hypothetical protein